MKDLNPATRTDKSAAERKRIPMSVPVQRLEAPDIPGFHLHWFLGTAERLQRALDGGYEFVDPREAKINNVSLGGDSAISGNTDMGSRVSVGSGQEVGKDGQPVRLVLMKIKQEWWDDDQKLVEQRNEQVAAALRGGMLNDPANPGDTSHSYLDNPMGQPFSRTKIPDLFMPKRPKAA